jgi:putative transposase
MKKSRFTESQIVAILKEADGGLKVADVCRKHGISQPTYYNGKSKYGSLSVAELKRIKELEAEHAKLKRMYADLAMENHALKELIEKSSDAGRAAGSSRLVDRGTGNARGPGQPASQDQPLVLVSATVGLPGAGRSRSRPAQRGGCQARSLGLLEMLPLASPAW